MNNYLKNSSAHAIRDLSYYYKELTVLNDSDNEYIGKAILDLNSAVHFSLPENGRIFDDNLKGVKGCEIRLPFPLITLEYVYVDQYTNEKQKRLILVQELDTDEIGDTEDEPFIARKLHEIYQSSSKIIICRTFLCINNKWKMIPDGFMIPSEWESLTDDQEIFQKSDRIDGRNYNAPMAVSRVVFLHNEYERCESGENCKTLRELLSEIIGVSFRSTLEFCEALTCSNVSHEAIESVNKKVNDKRISNGKLPIFESRILVINQSKNNLPQNNESRGCKHNSPREHLRRGHIRKYEDGKIIWVNSCVVGAKDNGIIEKSYKINM